MKSKIDITPPRNGQSGMASLPSRGRKSNTGCARRLLLDRGSVVKLFPRSEVAVPTESAMVAREVRVEFEV